MRDMLTLDRIQIEYAEQGPFIVVGAPQASSMRQLLNDGGVGFNMLVHSYTDDVMFMLNPDDNMVYVQTLLDQAD